jgi:cephalosporin hydroxylase
MADETTTPPPDLKRLAADVINRFHGLYYDGFPAAPVWKSTYWMGVRVLKCPLDMWVYQEILHETRPDVLIETGTHLGGSALFFAHMFDLIGKGRVITIDIGDVKRPVHPDITYLTGSSTDAATLRKVQDAIEPGERVMVVLDSDHSEQHVLRELEVYSPLVSVGCYLVVEDTNVNGHPAREGFGPGPYEAVDKFLAGRSDFVRDPAREKFMLTFNPDGWLKRVG